MAKWMMSLDEPGTFEEDKQYFIVAGIIYEYEDFDNVRDYFIPLINRMGEIIEEDELHSKEIGATKKKIVRMFYSLI